MRTPAQQAAARANGARSRGPKTPEGKRRCSMNAISLNLLANATVLKKESRESFQELLRLHTLCIAPRDAVEQSAVEEICSATWRLHRLRAIEHKTVILELAAQPSADDLECLFYACGALAGKDPLFHSFLQRYETRLRDIIRRSLARIRALRRTGEEEPGQTTPVGQTSGEAPAGPAGGTHCAPEP
jgi:hypothetical protein